MSKIVSKTVSKTVSTRLNERELNALNEIAKEESLDRSSLIKKFVIEQIKNHRMHKLGEFYRKGIVSLQEAATQAQVSLYEMMDYVKKEQICPPAQSDAEIQEEIDAGKRIMHNINRENKKKSN